MQFSGYKIKSDHRNLSMKKEKTQWTVDTWEELRLFSLAKECQWTCLEQKFLWSISARNKKANIIGHDFDVNAKAYLAKYRVDHQNEWHGYPIVPKDFDKPPKSVLASWRALGIVDDKTINLILQSKL